MAKKGKPQVINIQQLNLEIDYDKLAEAIVKAQKQTKPKKDTGKFRSAAMSFFNGAIYSVVYVFSVICIYTTWAESYMKQNAPLIGCIILSVMLFFIGIYAFCCQQETHHDGISDAREHFNINISLIALIVSIVALFKEVG